jgi:hypothetical protein
MCEPGTHAVEAPTIPPPTMTIFFSVGADTVVMMVRRRMMTDWRVEVDGRGDGKKERSSTSEGRLDEWRPSLARVTYPRPKLMSFSLADAFSLERNHKGCTHVITFKA